MSKRTKSIIIVLAWSCAAAYILLHQPKFKFSETFNTIGFKVFAFSLLAACLAMYGYLTNAVLVHPIIKSVAPAVTPKFVHEAFYYRAQSFYREYQKGKISLSELVKFTLVDASHEEREASYALYSLMDIDQGILARQLSNDQQELLLIGLEKAYRMNSWINVFTISSLITTICLSLLIINFQSGKAVLLTFVGLLVKHFAGRFS